MRVLSGLMFFPRGGSAHVARALAEELPAHGWEVTLVSGSLGGGGVGDAERFYAGLDVRTVDFRAGDAPMHPSYEDRPGAPDRVFATVDDLEYEAHVAAWAAALERAGAAGFDVLHLHHLTPLHEAAARVTPEVPVVAHVHGTELLMLERIAAGAPATWTHAGAWAARLRAWAGRAERLILLSASQLPRVARLLGPEVAARCVVSPNGFDPVTFAPRAVDRAAHWREHLVTSPRGWRPGAGEGSVRYTEAEIAALAAGPVLLSVGRFTEVKRMGLLVRAFARARRESAVPAALVLLGGHPGEWEGEHPWEAVRASGAPDVFLAGWHEHDTLAEFLNAADATVLASVREQFGLVLVEGMACGLPAIAVDRFGPAEIVEDGRTGWLVEPDDEAALAAAMRDAIERPDERARRGALARAAAVERWSWPAIAGRLSGVLAEAAARPLAPR
ncbi:MAG TPA: glycosyltransferase [Solirubrobacteraceae bacterium]|nr:glycosyltransferase [Solirubrobacteraceae bacterium]